MGKRAKETKTLRMCERISSAAKRWMLGIWIRNKIRIRMSGVREWAIVFYVYHCRCRPTMSMEWNRFANENNRYFLEYVLSLIWAESGIGVLRKFQLVYTLMSHQYMWIAHAGAHIARLFLLSFFVANVWNSFARRLEKSRFISEEFRHWRRLQWNMKQMAKPAVQKANCKEVDAVACVQRFLSCTPRAVCVCHYQFESRNSWTEKWIHFVLAFRKTSCSSGCLSQLENHPSIWWIRS